jgi:hypothetical protein
MQPTVADLKDGGEHFMAEPPTEFAHLITLTCPSV